MKTKRIAFTFLVLSLLACNLASKTFSEPTPTPSPSLTSTSTPEPLKPAYIPPGCEAIPLATVPAATALAQPTPQIQANPEIAPDIQVQVFEEVVDTIENVYVYPDFNGKDWSEIVSRYRGKIKSGLDTEVFYSEMQAMILELGDEHSQFLSPVVVALSEAELAGNNEFVGIGAYLLPQVEKGRGTIISVYPDSPAEHSGLKPHDSILAVDGLPLVENGGARPHRMRGPECSAVRLTVQSPGQSPQDILLLRHRIEGGLPVDARIVPTQDGSRVGYIMLPSFFDKTIPNQVAQALDNFGPLDGLILDNRLNGGGSSDVVEPILAHFALGILGAFKSRNDSRPLTIRPNPIHNSQTVPLVVLVGEDTASYGEIFAGVLKDSGRAKVAGQTTQGNVEVLHGYTFKDGSRLWIAQETFDPAISHADWETSGIIPDAEAYADWDTFTFETDPSVKAALGLLGHQ